MGVGGGGEGQANNHMGRKEGRRRVIDKRSFMHNMAGQLTFALGRHHQTGDSEAACPTHPPHPLQMTTPPQG